MTGEGSNRSELWAGLLGLTGTTAALTTPGFFERGRSFLDARLDHDATLHVACRKQTLDVTQNPQTQLTAFDAILETIETANRVFDLLESIDRLQKTRTQLSTFCAQIGVLLHVAPKLFDRIHPDPVDLSILVHQVHNGRRWIDRGTLYFTRPRELEQFDRRFCDENESCVDA